MAGLPVRLRLYDAADGFALTQHIIIILTPFPGQAGSEARLRISCSMSAPVLLGYAEGGDYTERTKERTQNNVTPTIHTPGCTRHCGKREQWA